MINLKNLKDYTEHQITLRDLIEYKLQGTFFLEAESLSKAHDKTEIALSGTTGQLPNFMKEIGCANKIEFQLEETLNNPLNHIRSVYPKRACKNIGVKFFLSEEQEEPGVSYVPILDTELGNILVF